MAVVLYAYNAKEIMGHFGQICQEAKVYIYGILVFIEAELNLDRISKKRKHKKNYDYLMKMFYGLDAQCNNPAFKGGIASLVPKEALLKFLPFEAKQSPERAR